MGLFDFLHKDDTIHLAVIGIPSSGKSYLISDMIKAFASMGYSSYQLEENDMVYQSTSAYDNDTHLAAQTPNYACRKFDHYGAKMVKNGSSFKIDFLNIPGEAFKDQDNTAKYFLLSSKLKSSAGKNLFKMVTWKNTSGEQRYVIEPRNPSPMVRDEITDAKSSPSISIDAQARRLNYMSWRQIFSELRMDGFIETPKSKNISGEYLLDNISRTVVDSAMASIGAVCGNFHIDGLSEAYEFELIANNFYFMNYCQRATDMVVCDKMFLPEGDDNSRNKDSITFPELCRQIVAFFEQEKTNKPHIYLAFRGADFLMQNKEMAYREIRRIIHNDENTCDEDMEIRNAYYSLFSYLLWHHVYCDYSKDTDQMLESRDLLGFIPETTNIANLKEKYLNISDHNGRTFDGGLLKSMLKSHIGTMGNAFCSLLNFSYDNLVQVPISKSETVVVPHVYFTCTPITNDFIIYKNDPKHPNKFINEKEQGDARKFEFCGSHLCFGSYQLCLDILGQHEKQENAYYGELLAETQNDQ